MHLITGTKINKYCQQFPDAGEPLRAWVKEAKHAHWTCPAEIKERFSNADFPGDGVGIFNIKGNTYRLVVRITYANEKTQGVVYVRWFGTHADYDRIDVRKI